jgi:hypothetical protein
MNIFMEKDKEMDMEMDMDMDMDMAMEMGKDMDMNMDNGHGDGHGHVDMDRDMDNNMNMDMDIDMDIVKERLQWTVQNTPDTFENLVFTRWNFRLISRNFIQISQNKKSEISSTFRKNFADHP